MTPWQRSQARSAPWFLAPALILLALFVGWPMVRAAIWSLSNTDLLRPSHSSFVGVGNYSALLHDPRFRQAFFNTACFALMAVPLQTVLALALALLVNRPEPHWRWLRRVFFFPVIVSMPVLAVLWTILYQPATGHEMGLINHLIVALGIKPQDWLGDPRWALAALAFMSIWQGVGLQMMVFLAGLQHVSKELLEAARLDGASAWQRLRYVVIPALRNTIIFVITVTIVLAFRLFAQPYLMTHGGPQNRTVSMVQSIYEMTFVNQDLGYACATTFLFLAVVGTITFLQRAFTRETEE